MRGRGGEGRRVEATPYIGIIGVLVVFFRDRNRQFGRIKDFLTKIIIKNNNNNNNKNQGYFEKVIFVRAKTKRASFIPSFSHCL